MQGVGYWTESLAFSLLFLQTTPTTYWHKVEDFDAKRMWKMRVLAEFAASNLDLPAYPAAKFPKTLVRGQVLPIEVEKPDTRANLLVPIVCSL